MPLPRVVLNGDGARAILRGDEVRGDVLRRAALIRAACNAESSWGQYKSDVVVQGDRAVARVWAISSNLPSTHNRHQRMIRKLDAGA